MLELIKISKSFGGQAVLSGASLKIPKGGRLGLIGGNATGKSTLINIATGFLRAEKGAVLLDKENLNYL